MNISTTSETGTADYRPTPGNLGAWIPHRREGVKVHVETFTLWGSEEAIRRFTGDNLLKARYCGRDSEFLLEFEPEVLHFEAVGED